MNGIPKRASMRSISIFGLSVVTIVFEDDADRAYVRNQAFERLQSVILPPGAQANLSPDSTPVGEIYRYTLAGPPGFSPLELKSLEDWVVERKLRTVPGVVDVVGFGGPTKQYQVNVDPLKLKSYGLTLRQVFDALSNGNRNAGGSYIEHGPRCTSCAASASSSRPATSARSRSRPAAGRPSGSATSARSASAPGSASASSARPSGRPTTTTSCRGSCSCARARTPSRCSSASARRSRRSTARGLPPGVKIVPHYDRTDLIDRTLHTVRQNMVEGIGLVLVVLVAFLGFRNIGRRSSSPPSFPSRSSAPSSSSTCAGSPRTSSRWARSTSGSSSTRRSSWSRTSSGSSRSAAARCARSPRPSSRPRPRSASRTFSRRRSSSPPSFRSSRSSAWRGKIFRPMALTLTFALIWGHRPRPHARARCSRASSVKRRSGAPGSAPEEESAVVPRLSRLYRPALAVVLARRKVSVSASVGSSLAIGVAPCRAPRLGVPPEARRGRAVGPRDVCPARSPRPRRPASRGRSAAMLASFPEVDDGRLPARPAGRRHRRERLRHAEIYVDLVPRDALEDREDARRALATR